MQKCLNLQPVIKAEMLLLFVSEQVGRLQCPLLLVVGEDDQMWPAYESAQDVSLLTRQHPVQCYPYY